MYVKPEDQLQIEAWSKEYQVAQSVIISRMVDTARKYPDIVASYTVHAFEAAIGKNLFPTEDKE